MGAGLLKPDDMRNKAVKGSKRTPKGDVRRKVASTPVNKSRTVKGESNGNRG